TPQQSDQVALDEPRMSDGDRERLRAYHREFIPGIVVYAIAVFVTAAFVGDDPAIPRRLLLLIPLLPAVWSARAIMRSVQRSDEFERMIQLEAMAVGFGAAMIGAMTVGFLGMHSDPNRFNQIAPWIIFSVGMASWGITVGIRTNAHR
ncbi:MAG: hypothetical protein AB8G14_19105, partial [Ilumatobacter sp.]